MTGWNHFNADTLGKQLVRAADSIGANLVEGDGRGRDADALRFFIYARASARETRYWIQCATIRGLIQPAEAEARITDLVSATQLLNRLIAYRRSTNLPDRVREERASYEVDRDPFTADTA